MIFVYIAFAHKMMKNVRRNKTSPIKVNGASHKGNTPFLGEAIKIKIVLFYALTIKPDC